MFTFSCGQKRIPILCISPKSNSVLPPMNLQLQSVAAAIS